MSQVIPQKPLRVVVWSTGTIGRHAIAGVDAHPDLELVGVWVSNPDKHGKDAGLLAELGRELGVPATTDRDELMALTPDAVVHTAMTDDRVFESIEDLIWMLGKGVNVVSSGPVLLQWPHGILPDEILARIEEAGRTGNASLHVNGIDPGFANDVLPIFSKLGCNSGGCHGKAEGQNGFKLSLFGFDEHLGDFFQTAPLGIADLDDRFHPNKAT